ncbi:protein timeless [Anaeramoeba flamelloides]|uniref:Protein timeless n=1 Tax=Anaeramoeba flamelloides TaxID=1746091 RepID=A0ABQ8Y133_9EUKA|nr:protein timeless [Anaeramoeba flamelloides]
MDPEQKKKLLTLQDKLGEIKTIQGFDIYQPKPEYEETLDEIYSNILEDISTGRQVGMTFIKHDLVSNTLLPLMKRKYKNNQIFDDCLRLLICLTLEPKELLTGIEKISQNVIMQKVVSQFLESDTCLILFTDLASTLRKLLITTIKEEKEIEQMGNLDEKFKQKKRNLRKFENSNAFIRADLIISLISHLFKIVNPKSLHNTCSKNLYRLHERLFLLTHDFHVLKCFQTVLLMNNTSWYFDWFSVILSGLSDCFGGIDPLRISSEQATMQQSSEEQLKGHTNELKSLLMKERREKKHQNQLRTTRHNRFAGLISHKTATGERRTKTALLSSLNSNTHSNGLSNNSNKLVKRCRRKVAHVSVKYVKNELQDQFSQKYKVQFGEFVDNFMESGALWKIIMVFQKHRMNKHDKKSKQEHPNFCNVVSFCLRKHRGSLLTTQKSKTNIKPQLKLTTFIPILDVDFLHWIYYMCLNLIEQKELAQIKPFICLLEEITRVVYLILNAESYHDIVRKWVSDLVYKNEIPPLILSAIKAFRPGKHDPELLRSLISISTLASKIIKETTSKQRLYTTKRRFARSHKTNTTRRRKKNTRKKNKGPFIESTVVNKDHESDKENNDKQKNNNNNNNKENKKKNKKNEDGNIDNQREDDKKNKKEKNATSIKDFIIGNFDDDEQFFSDEEDEKEDEFAGEKEFAFYENFFIKFCDAKIIENCLFLLSHYKENGLLLNSELVYLLDSIFKESSHTPRFFQLSTFILLNTILNDKDVILHKMYPKCKKLAKNITREFFRHLKKNPLLFIEILFKRSFNNQKWITDIQKNQLSFENLLLQFDAFNETQILETFTQDGQNNENDQYSALNGFIINDVDPINKLIIKLRRKKNGQQGIEWLAQNLGISQSMIKEQGVSSELELMTFSKEETQFVNTNEAKKLFDLIGAYQREEDSVWVLPPEVDIEKLGSVIEKLNEFV